MKRIVLSISLLVNLSAYAMDEQAAQRIHDIVASGNVDLLKAMLEQGADPNGKEEYSVEGNSYEYPLVFVISKIKELKSQRRMIAGNLAYLKDRETSLARWRDQKQYETMPGREPFDAYDQAKYGLSYGELSYNRYGLVNRGNELNKSLNNYLWTLKALLLHGADPDLKDEKIGLSIISNEKLNLSAFEVAQKYYPQLENILKNGSNIFKESKSDIDRNSLEKKRKVFDEAFIKFVIEESK